MVTSREYFYKYYRKAKKPRALETFARPYSFYCGELRYTAMVIDRYEKLCQQKNQSDDFNELLDDF